MMPPWPKLLVVCYCFFKFQEHVDAVIHTGKFGNHHKPPDPEYTINKVSLTQKGYIQFLRYINDVPPLKDYTFCIWIRSNNLTHSHPILSYSQHEETRLIRVWIIPLGRGINLEILNHSIFEVPVNLVENHWYHICQSWSSQHAAWSLFLNGKLKTSGFEPKLRGMTIEGGGDIVVGQEYTDFDKGLDDGIEGDIFGFNFVLASTSHALAPSKTFSYPPKYPEKYQRLSTVFPYKQTLRNNDQTQHNKSPVGLNLESITGQGTPLTQTFPRKASLQFKDESDLSSEIGDISNVSRKHSYSENAEVPDVLSYFSNQPNRDPKGLFNMFQNVFRFLEPERIKIPVYRRSPVYVNPPVRRFGGPSVALNEINEAPKPLGLVLVELSFDCAYKKGAPLSGKDVLINWTKSPVRVFGGAILKSVPPFCV